MEYYLKHHGIEGQKWGVENGPPYPLDDKDHSAAEKKAGWRQSLREHKQQAWAKKLQESREKYAGKRQVRYSYFKKPVSEEEFFNNKKFDRINGRRDIERKGYTDKLVIEKLNGIDEHSNLSKERVAIRTAIFVGTAIVGSIAAVKLSNYVSGQSKTINTGKSVFKEFKFNEFKPEEFKFEEFKPK